MVLDNVLLIALMSRHTARAASVQPEGGSTKKFKMLDWQSDLLRKELPRVIAVTWKCTMKAKQLNKNRLPFKTM